MHAIAGWSIWFSVSLVFLLSLLLAGGGVWVVRRYWPYPAFQGNNEFVGFSYGVFGLVYGVLLAFVIVSSWEQFSEAESVVVKEVTSLNDLWRDTQVFSPKSRELIHADLIAYVESVIADEWPRMANFGDRHFKTQAAHEKLWENFYEFKPGTEVEGIYLREALTRMNQVSESRRERIMLSSSELVALIWVILIGGAIPAAAFALFFATKHGFVQFLITFFILNLLGLSLLLAVSLQYPFTGQSGISSLHFTELKSAFGQRESRESLKPGSP